MKDYDLFILWPNEDGVLVRQTVDRSLSSLRGYCAIRGNRCFGFDGGVYEEVTMRSKKAAEKWFNEVRFRGSLASGSTNA